MMNDDIVTRLRDTIYTGGYLIGPKAADEIERLRTLLDNTLVRENKDNARQLEIVRKVEADRDRWKKAAELMYEKANPKGAPICDCNVCEEYKYLAEGNIKMDYSTEVKTKYQYLYDREEYWVVMADADGCLHKVGASFISKDEAKQYVEWRNDQDNNKKVDG
jgi:hypothetical protein